MARKRIKLRNIEFKVLILKHLGLFSGSLFPSYKIHIMKIKTILKIILN